MNWLAIAGVVLLGACGRDEGHIVNVAPSAHEQMGTIADAVDRLNELAGHESWWVRAVDHEHRRDDEIIVRQDRGVRVTDTDIVHGKTVRTHKGVIIHIPANVSVRAFAHELGHAGGLDHVSDSDNLMYKRDNAGEWTLTEDQLNEIL